MKMFQYVIKDEIGIHARPAGKLVKNAKQFVSNITIQKGDKKADATKLLAILGLCVKKDDNITVQIEGTDEVVAYDQVKEFLEREL